MIYLNAGDTVAAQIVSQFFFDFIKNEAPSMKLVLEKFVSFFVLNASMKCLNNELLFK